MRIGFRDDPNYISNMKEMRELRFFEIYYWYIHLLLCVYSRSRVFKTESSMTCMTIWSSLQLLTTPSSSSLIHTRPPTTTNHHENEKSSSKSNNSSSFMHKGDWRGVGKEGKEFLDYIINKFFSCLHSSFFLNDFIWNVEGRNLLPPIIIINLPKRNCSHNVICV